MNQGNKEKCCCHPSTLRTQLYQDQDCRLMFMYTRTYRSLVPVVDPDARQRLMHASAPPILGGTPIDDELLFSARMERQLREVEAQRGTVTRQEVFAAVVREHAVLAEHAAAAYPITIAAVLAPTTRQQ
ncbi:hypothetical protein PHYPSEUDO_005367 [Phytophthora pseudosyringae]|uniref:Uncharacterized protein n=1 Tax=Phytophthora pseudosyringae TaxID=221518 RepID=A0A8T1VM50_9STRA|nr:hypothetical protein PHYPSEUDO_005367 [Phytophthora pseudosyringae]